MVTKRLSTHKLYPQLQKHHIQVLFIITLQSIHVDSRLRSGEVDIPNDLLDGLGFELNEEILKLTLEEVQVRTNFPEKWLYEDMKAG